MNDREETLKYLKDRIVAVVATVTPEGEPQAATVNYFVDDDFNLYFLTRKGTRKFVNLAGNSRVAAVVGTELEPHTVQIQGDAVVVESERELKLFDAALESHPALYQLYFGMVRRHPVFPSGQDSDVAIIRVRIRWLRWMTYDPATMTEEFRQIIP